MTRRDEVKSLRVAIASVDVVLFRLKDLQLQVLLLPVHRPPHYPHTAGLPGGIIAERENADESAARHLLEKTGIQGVHIEQLYTFSNPDRDKRSRSISITYMALIPSDGQDDAVLKEGARWVSVSSCKNLAYDHTEIVKTAVERLRSKLAYTSIVSRFLPRQFTLGELQSAYEVALGKKIDKRNFRKKVIAIGMIKKTNKQRRLSGRPATLHEFAKSKTETIAELSLVKGAK